MGPQVAELENKLAQFAGVKHCVSCANGTDALVLVLRAWDIGPGDAVFVPAFTFAATAEVVALVGASPVFVDVLPDTYNMDPAGLEAAIALVKRDGKLAPRAVIPVDLFGQPADYRTIEPIVRREGLTDGRRMAWMTVVLLVPFLGPPIYLLAGGSPIPRSLRLFLVFGALLIYLVVAAVAFLAEAL